jgi:hypothetical protein
MLNEANNHQYSSNGEVANNDYEGHDSSLDQFDEEPEEFCEVDDHSIPEDKELNTTPKDKKDNSNIENDDEIYKSLLQLTYEWKQEETNLIKPLLNMNDQTVQFINENQLIDYDDNGVQKNKEPIYFFKLFFTDYVLDNLVDQTNLYANDEIRKLSKMKIFSCVKRWKKVNRNDIQKYIGLKLWMGMHSNSYYQGI